MFKSRRGFLVTPFCNSLDTEFYYHRNGDGKIRKYRRYWTYKPVTEELRATFWNEITTTRWVSRIFPTVRDKQILFALRCLFPDVQLSGATSSSWQKKNQHYRGNGYSNLDGTQFTLRDAAIHFFIQRGRCTICEPEELMLDLRPNAPYKTAACADDNHKKESNVRGLLCALHNKGLGHMKESRGGLGRATAYLHRHGNYEDKTLSKGGE